jgi:hypothetical protein
VQSCVIYTCIGNRSSKFFAVFKNMVAFWESSYESSAVLGTNVSFWQKGFVLVIAKIKWIRMSINC